MHFLFYIIAVFAKVELDRMSVILKEKKPASAQMV